MSLESENSKKPILLLVDGHSLAFRSFYAFSNSNYGGLTTKEGIPTSVTYGFLKSLLDNCKKISPEGVCITFDTEKPTFRHVEDASYKANRGVAPDEFFEDVKQLELILKESLKLPIFKSPGGPVRAKISGKVEISTEAKTRFYKIPYAPKVTKAENNFLLKIIPSNKNPEQTQVIKVSEKSLLFVENEKK